MMVVSIVQMKNPWDLLQHFLAGGLRFRHPSAGSCPSLCFPTLPVPHADLGCM
jgi:hypothetical protein